MKKEPIKEPTALTSLIDLSHLLPKLLPRLWAFALRITRDRSDAENLVRLTCIRALNRKHQLQPGMSPLNWMYSILHTIWINKAHMHPELELADTDWKDSCPDTAFEPTDDDREARELGRKIVHAVDQLPDAQRIVLLLVMIEGVSYREAATILDVPVSVIENRLSKARRAVAIQLATQPKLQNEG
ncbi:MAG TPA: RNA polymerase sigma factor [Paraburkholderia sp.]